MNIAAQLRRHRKYCSRSSWLALRLGLVIRFVDIVGDMGWGKCAAIKTAVFGVGGVIWWVWVE